MFGFRWSRFLSGSGEGEQLPAAWFSSLPVLETERLVLRPVRRTDVRDLFAWTSDPEVARYVLWEAHRSPADTRAYISYMRNLYRRGLPGSWAVVLRETGRVIGTVGFMWYSDANRAAEAGYSFSREYWNRGYATEALRAAVGAAFAALPLNRLEAQHDVRNPASGRVMEKSGMRKEGILRGRLYNKSGFVDVALYAVLNTDLSS